MANIKYKQNRKIERDTPMFELLRAIRDHSANEISALIFKKTKQRVAPQTIRNWRNNKTRYASTRTERLALKAMNIQLVQIPQNRLQEVQALLKIEKANKQIKFKTMEWDNKQLQVPIQ